MNINHKKGSYQIDDVSVSDIADKFGTPCFIYSANSISQNFSEIKDIFIKHNLHIRNIKGINLNPISNNWKLTDNTSINYILSLSKQKAYN